MNNSPINSTKNSSTVEELTNATSLSDKMLPLDQAKPIA